MPTIAEARAAYAALDSATLQCWHNLWDEMRRYGRAGERMIGIHPVAPKSPFMLAYISWQYQELIEGSTPMQGPYWVLDDFWMKDRFTVFDDNSLFSLSYYQHDDFPTMLDDYGVRLYNVRKTYWTGVPRRRRNL